VTRYLAAHCWAVSSRANRTACCSAWRASELHPSSSAVRDSFKRLESGGSGASCCGTPLVVCTALIAHKHPFGTLILHCGHVGAFLYLFTDSCA
jgi:hypothetical protein